MSYYTLFHAILPLKGPKPNQALLDLLNFMLGEADTYDEAFVEAQEHEFFETQRWAYMLSSSSAYFDSPALSKLCKDSLGNYTLFVQCDFKNYNGEIVKFLNWLLPYTTIKPSKFIGYVQGEDEAMPQLLTYTNA